MKKLFLMFILLVVVSLIITIPTPSVEAGQAQWWECTATCKDFKNKNKITKGSARVCSVRSSVTFAAYSRVCTCGDNSDRMICRHTIQCSPTHQACVL